MIFIAGVHGVGKSYICNQLKKDFTIYSASGLIEQYGKIQYYSYKKVYNIGNNQSYLVNAVKQKEKHGEKFILDGHFCLFNANNEVEKISLNIFEQLLIEGIILVWDKEGIIWERIQNREKKTNLLTVYEIAELQEQEIEYAQIVAKELNVPLVHVNASDKNAVLLCRQFISTLFEDNGKPCV